MKTALNQPLKSSTFPQYSSAVDLFRSMWKGWGVKVLSLMVVLMVGLNWVMGQQVIGNYPDMNGGLEDATIDNSTFSSAQAGKWVRNNNSQTIASETSTIRSGATSLSITNGSTGRRVWTPLVTVSSTTSNVTIQYYRRVSSTINAQESQAGVGNGTTTDVSSNSYSVPSSANTWEKVTYTRSSFTFTDIAGAILTRSVGAGGSIFIDDLVMYKGSVDNAAPNSPGTLTVNNPSTTSLDLSWVAASSVDAGGYVVVRYTSSPNANNDPNQNGIYAVGNTTTNGTGSLTGTIRYIGTGTSFTDDVGLSAGTQYWYKVYTVDKAFNYSAESSGNGTTTSSSSSLSNIILNAGFTHPTNINYSAYQATSGLTTGNSIEVGQFDIQDGGGSSDADALSTTLTDISFTVANFGNIGTLALFDGSTNVAEITSVTATSSFSSLTLAAADDGSKTFSIRATFKSAVTDNQQFSFTVSSATASGSGSSFAAANAGAAATSTTGDNNRIEVTTTGILFDQNPTTVSQNAVMSPSPTVLAVDNNANFDLDNTSNVVMTITTGLATFASATTTVAMVAGIATFTNLVFATAANTNQLTATQGAFTDVSSNFNVTASSPEINVKQGITSLFSGSGTYAAGNIVSGNSGSPVTFTIENIGSANLTYSSITSSNTSDFTLDLTNTSSPIAASGTTIFTLSFNPSTAGAKSTTITINNNDLDEGAYTFTVTGTGTVSTASDIISSSGYSYSSNINYASYQSVSILTTGNSVGVNGLTIRDGGATTDTDNLATTLTAITFSTGGSTAFRTAALFDGSTNIAEVAVNGGTSIAFSGLTLSTGTDGGTKNFELRVTYQASVTDNQQITFTVSSASASATNSGFAAANAGAAASTATSDINRLEVTASALAFVTQPANTLVGAGMSNVTVSANDGNGNRDLDFTNSVRITSTGTLTGTPVDVSASSGLATFPSLTHTAPGSSLTLNAERTSGLDWDVTSSTFNLTVQAPGLLLTDDDFNYTVSSNIITVGTGWGITSGNATKVNTTATSNGLTMTNYPSTNTVGISFIAGTGEDVAKSFTAQTSGSVYASTLINLTSTGAGSYVFGFSPTNTSPTYDVRVHVRTVTGNLNFGISRASGTVTWDATNYSFSTTYFVAVKLTMNASSNDDRIDLFVSTSISNSEPSTPNATISGTNDVASTAAVFVRQDASAGAGTIDGIRVATNWGTLVGNPQYNSTSDIGAGNYNNINVISGTITATGNVTVFGALSLNAGTLDIGSSTFVINGPVSQTSGNIDADAGTVSFNNANDLSLPTSLFSGNIYNLSKASGAGTVTLNDNLTVTNELNSTASIGAFIIASSKELAVSGTGKATINGTITNNGTFTLNSGATLLQGEFSSITGGTYNVKQDITGSSTTSGTISPNGRFWYLGAALSDASSTALLSNNNQLWQWNEDSFGYSPVTSGNLTQGRSYVLRSGQATETINFSGASLSNGTVNVTGLTRSGTTQNYRGCHLISNPYPSYLDWNSITKTNIGTTMYIRTAIGTTLDVMETFNSSGSIATTISSVPLTQYIAPMQGFWVKVTTDGQTGSLTMNNTMRSHQSSGSGLRSTPQDFPAFLRFNMLDGQNKDQVILLMSPDAAMSLDAFDSEKMSASGYAQFYSTVNATKLVINGMKNVKAKTSVPLTLVMPTSKSYTFQAEEFNIEDGLILLEDKQEGVIQDLTINPTYSFFGNAGTNATRFVVHFQLATAPVLVGGPQELESLGSDELTTDNIQIVSNNQGTVIIRLAKGFKPEGSIRIFDASGRLVEQTDLNDQETTIQLNEQAGMYFVEVSAGKLMVKKKIVIN